MDPPYNVGEEMFCYSLAAAIWILDAIRANQKMDEALTLLPKDKNKLNSVRLPKCVSPCYSEAVLRSMVYTILHRNEDCTGLVKSPKDPARVFVTDGYTIAGKQHQDVPSRRVFEGILALLPEDMVDNALTPPTIEIVGFPGGGGKAYHHAAYKAASYAVSHHPLRV